MSGPEKQVIWLIIGPLAVGFGAMILFGLAQMMGAKRRHLRERYAHDGGGSGEPFDLADWFGGLGSGDGDGGGDGGGD